MEINLEKSTIDMYHSSDDKEEMDSGFTYLQVKNFEISVKPWVST